MQPPVPTPHPRAPPARPAARVREAAAAPAPAKRAPGAPEQQGRSFRLWGAAHPNRGTPAATSGLVFALPALAPAAFFFPPFFFGILSRTDAAQPSTKDRSSGDDSVDATQVAFFLRRS